jgi:hypothetical protein
VLGTSSSESALPALIEKMERAGCPKTVVGLVVPTGYSFNLDGTNIYMTLAALFIAQACNVHLTLGQQACCWAWRCSRPRARRGDRRGLHHAGGHAVDRAHGAGGGHGADPGDRPLHVRMPQPDQFHRQCRGDRGGLALGRALDRERSTRAATGVAAGAAGRTRTRTLENSGARRGIMRANSRLRAATAPLCLLSASRPWPRPRPALLGNRAPALSAGL